MRQKLIELLDTVLVCSTGDTGECDSCQYSGLEDACIRHMTEVIADFMLSNGVVVLPVKPGDTVYTIHRGRIKEWQVYYVGMNSVKTFMFNFADKELQNSRSACDADIGNIVFLTEEDASNELKERKANERS